MDRVYHVCIYAATMVPANHGDALRAVELANHTRRLASSLLRLPRSEQQHRTLFLPVPDSPARPASSPAISLSQPRWRLCGEWFPAPCDGIRDPI